MTSLLLFFSGLALGAVYARLLPVLRRPRKVQPPVESLSARAWDKFENSDATYWDANVPYTETGYYPGEYNYHPEGHNGNGMPGWY